MRYWIEACYTTSRPVIPDEHRSIIMLDEPDDTTAQLIAAQWVAAKRGVQMPTRTTILQVEI